jgi:hypothetical protein
MSAAITAEIVIAAGEAYSAYDSSKTAHDARSMANTTAGKQNYYNDLLKNLMSNPDSFFNTQVFQSANNLGLQAAERKMNSMGYKDSGNILSALQQQGEGFAFGALQNQEQILAGISGVNAASSPSQLLGASTGAQTQSDQQLNKLLSDVAFMSGGASGVSGAGASYTGGSVVGGETTGAAGNWMGGSGMPTTGQTDTRAPFT